MWIALAVVIATGCIVVPIGLRMLSSSMQYCHEVSAWGALDCSIMLELGDYYDENGKYPDSLEVLPLVYEDGAMPDMLSKIQYDSQRASCKYSYTRHAGKWDTHIKTRVEISFSQGKSPRKHETTIHVD